jgi:proteasome lid subunit RPN8/RPN11
MGEHISEKAFLIKDFSMQRHGGTLFSFVRAARYLIEPMRRFFMKTGYNYTHFNYLGEWHSHPSFPPSPSVNDCDTMWSIVEDPEVGANFAVLVIVRLNGNGDMEGTATVFLPHRKVLAGTLLLEKRKA